MPNLFKIGLVKSKIGLHPTPPHIDQRQRKLVITPRLSGARPPKLVVDSSRGRAGFNQMPNIPTARL